MSLFFLQLGGELRKLFARKRTYIGFGAFLLVELLVLGLMQLPRNQRWMTREITRRGFLADDYFSGLTLANQMLGLTIFFLGALYLALVAGDVVAKEVEEGTLRMMLCRPVSRLRLLLVKYAACVLYTFALIIFIGVTALLAGVAWRGTGGLFVFAPMDNLFAFYEWAPGLLRYAATLPLLGLSLLSITSLAFALSCCNVKPAAATIVTLSYLFMDEILRRLPYFESIRGWFLTTHMVTWMNVFRPHLPVAQMVEDYAYLLGVDVTLVIIGVLIFQGRDFKS